MDAIELQGKIVVRATQYNNAESRDEILRSINRGRLKEDKFPAVRDGDNLVIPGPRGGEMLCRHGDWVIRTPDGNYYVMTNGDYMALIHAQRRRDKL